MLLDVVFYLFNFCGCFVVTQSKTTWPGFNMWYFFWCVKLDTFICRREDFWDMHLGKYVECTEHSSHTAKDHSTFGKMNLKFHRISWHSGAIAIPLRMLHVLHQHWIHSFSCDNELPVTFLFQNEAVIQNKWKYLWKYEYRLVLWPQIKGIWDTGRVEQWQKNLLRPG